MEINISEKLNFLIMKIIKIRKEKGYSLEYIANCLNITTAAYDKIEKQKTKLTIERLFKLKQILEIDWQDLLKEEITSSFRQ